MIELAYEITYQDGKGNVTERTIIPMEEHDDRYRAFCFLRMGMRTFLKDRIMTQREVVVGLSDEVLSAYEGHL